MPIVFVLEGLAISTEKCLHRRKQADVNVDEKHRRRGSPQEPRQDFFFCAKAGITLMACAVNSIAQSIAVMSHCF